jgi:hypothetical protein
MVDACLRRNMDAWASILCDPNKSVVSKAFHCLAGCATTELR